MLPNDADLHDCRPERKDRSYKDQNFAPESIIGAVGALTHDSGTGVLQIFMRQNEYSAWLRGVLKESNKFR